MKFRHVVFLIRMLEVLFRALIVISWIRLIQAQDISPSCSLLKAEFASLDQDTFHNATMDSNNYCTIMKEPDNCLSYNKFLSLNTKFSDSLHYEWRDNKKYAYVNATVDYYWGSHSNRFLLQENVVKTCWNIQVIGEEPPSHVAISNIPVSANFSGLIAATVFSEETNHHSCISSKKSCKILNDSTLDFSPNSNMKSVRLMIHIEEEFEYLIELLSGQCNLTCEGRGNKCNVTIQSEVINFNSKERHHHGFYNLTPAFYCARIGSTDGCCVIHTETVRLDVPTEVTVVIVRDPLASYAIQSLVFVAILTLLLLLYAVKSKLPGIIRKLKPPLNECPVLPPVEDCVVALVPETDVNLLIQEMKDTVQVYLVYSYDSEDFLKLMKSFRRLLSCFVQRVWDPFSDEDMESVSEDISNWVNTIMTDKMIQVIIVETESAIRRERNCFEGWTNDAVESKHYLYNSFIYTLSYFRNDIHRLNDYSRNFIVRLDPTLSTNFNILPFTRYQMPRDFETLIFDLSRHISRRINIEYQDFYRLNLCSKEKDEFIEAQELFNLTNTKN